MGAVLGLSMCSLVTNQLSGMIVPVCAENPMVNTSRYPCWEHDDYETISLVLHSYINYASLLESKHQFLGPWGTHFSGKSRLKANHL